MARVRESSSPQPQPTLVTGKIFGAGFGQDVIVTLDRVCTWQGVLMPTRMQTRTMASGVFSLELPPNAELTPVDGSPVPQYALQAPGVRRVYFVVPAGVREWRLEL